MIQNYLCLKSVVAPLVNNSAICCEKKILTIVIEVAWAQICQDEALLTVIISPRHLAHSMDKRTRANENGDWSA
jgi:hypothetical protein